MRYRKKDNEGLERMVTEEADKRPRILTLDIETSPIIAYAWGPKYETRLLDFIQHSQVMSYSAKWLDEEDIITKGLPDYKGYRPGVTKMNDKKIVKELHKLYEEADFIVTYNGDKFDNKRLNSRFLKHGLAPVAPYKSIDLYKAVKGAFNLPSYKLNDVAEYFDVGEKVSTGGFGLWQACMDGDEDAWEKMLEYNEQDVALTEELYLKIRPYIKNHPNLSVHREDCVCPKCGSKELQMRGYAKTSASVFRRFQCKDCTGWGRYPIREYGIKTNRNV